MASLVEIVCATNPVNVEQVRGLFVEYAQSLGFSLCFQDFEKELAELPGVYAKPEGKLLLGTVDGEPAGCVGLRKLGHGGLANRGFWDGELKTFAGQYHVIALDLPGHGDSGSNRQQWGIPQFGADVRAVIEAEHITKAILFGNSLGGPVAIEAALMLPERVLAVVGVDTFQSLTYKITRAEARQRADAFRSSYSAALNQMVKALFHSDADPALLADAEQRMSRTSSEAAYRMFLSMGGYDPSVSALRLAIPLRAINGDLYPTDVAGVRTVTPDFDVRLMKHTGHYPMLERPEEFDRLVAETVTWLMAKCARPDCSK